MIYDQPAPRASTERAKATIMHTPGKWLITCLNCHTAHEILLGPLPPTVTLCPSCGSEIKL